MQESVIDYTLGVHMQSIETRFIAPASVKGARIKAIASGGAFITLSWDDALNTDANHDAAAHALILKMGWNDRGIWHSGGLKDGGNVYVCAQTDDYYGTELKIPPKSGK